MNWAKIGILFLQEFLSTVHDARAAADWIRANQQLFKQPISEPWVVSASDDRIAQFLNSQLTQDASFDDIRDHTMFDFDDSDDLGLFLKRIRSLKLQVNVSLHGADYLRDHCNVDW